MIDEFGRGSFTTVFRARYPLRGREAALKILHPQLLSGAALVELIPWRVGDLNASS